MSTSSEAETPLLRKSLEAHWLQEHAKTKHALPILDRVYHVVSVKYILPKYAYVIKSVLPTSVCVVTPEEDWIHRKPGKFT